MHTTAYASFANQEIEYGELVAIGILYFTLQYITARGVYVEKSGIVYDGETFEINLN